METPSEDQRQDYEDLTGPPLVGPPVEKVATQSRKPSRAANIMGMVVGILIPLAFFALVLSPSVCGIRDAARRRHHDLRARELHGVQGLLHRRRRAALGNYDDENGSR